MINERRYSPESVNAFVSAAKFLYPVTPKTPWPEHAPPRCRVPERLPWSTPAKPASFSSMSEPSAIGPLCHALPAVAGQAA